MKKRQYEKPKVTKQKIKAFFFACKVTAGQGCTSFFKNKTVGAGCPNP